MNAGQMKLIMKSLKKGRDSGRQCLSIIDTVYTGKPGSSRVYFHDSS